MLDVVKRLRRVGDGPDRRDAGRRRRGLRLLPGELDVLAELHVCGQRAADRGRGRPPARSSSVCVGGLQPTGCSSRRSALQRPLLPRTIGVVTGERGKARDDVLAGLRRRGWAGQLVWAFAPVQDRHAAPRIAAALRELAAVPEVEVVIVTRGGGSLADLFAFCDEGLCRTVALLRVPVISSVGHHTDRTLIDDVAAVCCSTPTHAAEAAVPIDCDAARRQLVGYGHRLQRHGRRAIVGRARALSVLSRAPGRHVRRHRERLHQMLRELRASARRIERTGTPASRRPPARVATDRRPRSRLRGREAPGRPRAAAAGARRPRSRSGRSSADTRSWRTVTAVRSDRLPTRRPPARSICAFVTARYPRR